MHLSLVVSLTCTAAGRACEELCAVTLFRTASRLAWMQESGTISNTRFERVGAFLVCPHKRCVSCEAFRAALPASFGTALWVLLVSVRSACAQGAMVGSCLKLGRSLRTVGGGSMGRIFEPWRLHARTGILRMEEAVKWCKLERVKSKVRALKLVGPLFEDAS